MPLPTNVPRALLTLAFALAVLAIAPYARPQTIPADPGNFVTNLGKTILCRTELVITGTISQNIRRLGTMRQRDFVVERIHWGATRHVQLTVTYDGGTLLDDASGRVTLCLNPIDAGSSSCRLVASPMLANDSTVLDAVASYCRIESASTPAIERTQALRDLLISQIQAGGTPARLAVVELVFLVQRNYEVFWHSHFEALQEAAKGASGRLKSDINLALRGMVELILKPDAQYEVRHNPSNEQRIFHARRLESYLRDFPGAFGTDDAIRCGMISGDAPPILHRILTAIQSRIMLVVEARRAEAAANENPWLARGTDWLSRELTRRRQREAGAPAEDYDWTSEPFGVEGASE